MFSFFVQQHHVDLFYFFFLLLYIICTCYEYLKYSWQGKGRGGNTERESAQVVVWVGFPPGHQTLVTLSSPAGGVYEYWGRCCCTMWSGCSCHVHYFAFKRSSKSKSPKALNEAREREKGREREWGRQGVFEAASHGRLLTLTRFMSKINVN